MTDREKKKVLKDRIERFLFDKVEWETPITDELAELSSIIDAMVALKFEGGHDRVYTLVADSNKNTVVAVLAPLPGTLPDDIFVSACFEALQELTAGQAAIQMNMHAMMSSSD